jgi:hypothetical protein
MAHAPQQATSLSQGTLKHVSPSNISDSSDGEYEDDRLLRCCVVLSGRN